jgi:hypothetical protein
MPRLTLAEWRARETEKKIESFALELASRDFNTKNVFIEAQMAKADEFFRRLNTGRGAY